MRDCLEVTRQRFSNGENRPESLSYLSSPTKLFPYLENSATNLPLSLSLSLRLWKMYRHDLRVARSLDFSLSSSPLTRGKIDRQKRSNLIGEH